VVLRPFPQQHFRNILNLLRPGGRDKSRPYTKTTCLPALGISRPQGEGGWFTRTGPASKAGLLEFRNYQDRNGE
jgi:hypothetical protein